MRLKVGIICACNREITPFLHHINNLIISEKAILKIYQRTINSIDVVALCSGVCKVNAAISTQILIDHYGVNIIINSGTAGGINPELEIFDVVISTEAAYHDVAPENLTEFHPFMESVYFQADKKLLELTKIAACKMRANKVHWGRMVTGEQFITDGGRKEINDKFAPLTVDMETASIAHVCYVNKVPFISIRSITDTAVHSGSDNFELNCQKASVIAKDFTLALLDEMI